MATIPIGKPRRVDPSLLDIGDDILVEHPKDRGMTMTLRGIIAKRIISGNSRYYLTTEGATLVAWQPNKTTKVKITLFGREDQPQETLFDAWDEVRQHSA